ncbi:MAG: GDP-L-fucose synthase [Mariprofundaceae bacterium]|nr:GDP-L-fucose synthase [Mariprofundaceae bacterium]
MNKDDLIYVAGHRGLVGSSIVRQLKSEGFQNILLKTSKEVNLCCQSAVDQLFVTAKPNYVFLAAAKVGGIYANDTYPADFIRDNLQIQTNVIDAAYRHGVKKFVFLGSSCIYPKLAPQPMSESCLLTGALEPTNEWYAIAKIAGIKMCQAYRKQYGFNAISLMPTNLYGPNDNFNLENSHVLPALIRKFHLAKLASEKDVVAIEADENNLGIIPDAILKAMQVQRCDDGSFAMVGDQPQVALWGSGAPCREFLHVDDLAKASLYLMRHYDQSEIVNVGVGEDVSIRSLAELVQEVVGFKGEVIWDASKPDGTMRKLMNVDKINALGWSATIALEEGLMGVYQRYNERFKR